MGIERVAGPVEERPAERAVRGFIADDAAEHALEQRMARRVPRAAQHRHRERLADAVRGDDYVRGLEERRIIAIGRGRQEAWIVADRRAAAELFGYPRAHLDVHDLVERKPA